MEEDEICIILPIKDDHTWGSFYEYIAGMTAPLIYPELGDEGKWIAAKVVLAAYIKARMHAPVQQDIELFIDYYIKRVMGLAPSGREMH